MAATPIVRGSSFHAALVAELLPECRMSAEEL